MYDTCLTYINAIVYWVRWTIVEVSEIKQTHHPIFLQVIWGRGYGLSGQTDQIK